LILHAHEPHAAPIRFAPTRQPADVRCLRERFCLCSKSVNVGNRGAARLTCGHIGAVYVFNLETLAAPVRFLRFAVCYFSCRATATRLLTSSRVAICQWWHNCMNFERLAGSEPRRCLGDMVSSILIAALRFMGGRFIAFLSLTHADHGDPLPLAR